MSTDAVYGKPDASQRQTTVVWDSSSEASWKGRAWKIMKSTPCATFFY